VETVQTLDIINMKDLTQKCQFYKITLKESLPFIPKVRFTAAVAFYRALRTGWTFDRELVREESPLAGILRRLFAIDNTRSGPRRSGVRPPFVSYPYPNPR